MPTQKIVAPPAKAAMFLVLTVNEGAEAQVADVLTGVSDLTKAVSFRVPTSNLLCFFCICLDSCCLVLYGGLGFVYKSEI